MKISIIAVGRCRSPSINAIADDYLGRIKKYAAAELIEIELKSKSAGARIRKKISPDDRVVALDEKGKNFSSPAFAGYIDKLLMRSGRLIFLIGGADGFDRETTALIHEKISLSPMTFQHDMARVVFLEQLYRAFTIMKGEPYHR